MPRHISSCSLVISRANTTGRSPPQTSAKSDNVRSKRCGASYNTVVRRSRATSVRRSRRSAPLRGKKPSNAMRAVGKPLIAAAMTNATGPGVECTVCPAAIAACTSLSPGSLMAGVPASVMTDTVAPEANAVSTVSMASCSVCSFVTTKRSGDAPILLSSDPL